MRPALLPVILVVALVPWRGSLCSTAGMPVVQRSAQLLQHATLRNPSVLRSPDLPELYGRLAAALARLGDSCWEATHHDLAETSPLWIDKVPRDVTDKQNGSRNDGGLWICRQARV